MRLLADIVHTQQTNPDESASQRSDTRTNTSSIVDLRSTSSFQPPCSQKNKVEEAVLW